MMNDNEKKLAGEIAEETFRDLIERSERATPLEFQEHVSGLLTPEASLPTDVPAPPDTETIGLMLGAGAALVAFCQHRGGITFKFETEESDSNTPLR